MSQKVELILSSGFLAFAHHCAFLANIESKNFQVKGIMGTSSGAIAGALFAAGYSSHEISKELNRLPPIKLMKLRPHHRKGLMNMSPVMNRLKDILPERIEDLNIPFAAGVVNQSKQFMILNTGPLAPAVCASMAIPGIFHGVDVPGKSDGPFMDGGVKDRIGLNEWSKSPYSSPDNLKLVHLIEKSTKLSGDDQLQSNRESKIRVIESPRSGEFFFKLRKFNEQFKDSKVRIARELSYS